MLKCVLWWWWRGGVGGLPAAARSHQVHSGPRAFAPVLPSAWNAFSAGVCKVGFLASCRSQIRDHLPNEGSLTSTLKTAHHAPLQRAPSPPALSSSVHSPTSDVFMFSFLHILAVSSRWSVSPIGPGGPGLLRPLTLGIVPGGC